MPHVQDPVPSLVGGVSQQPDPIRLRTQAQDIRNAYLSGVEGFTKRQPTRHSKRLVTSIQPGVGKPHTIDRDESERYISLVRQGDCKVWDLEGTEYPIYSSIRNLLKSPDNFTLGANWLESGPGAITVTQNDAEGPDGTSASAHRLSSSAAGQQIYQNITKSTEWVFKKGYYTCWGWVKRGDVDVSRITFYSGYSSTDYKITWNYDAGTGATFPVLSAGSATGIGTGPGIHEWGFERHNNDWWFFWCTIEWHDVASESALSVAVFPRDATSASGAYIWATKFMIERGRYPTRAWVDQPSSWAADFSYLDFRTPNLLDDPEDFTTWTKNGDAIVPVSSSEVPPLGFGTAYDLGTTGAATGPALYDENGTYTFAVSGTDNIYSVYVKAHASTPADRVVLILKDTTDTLTPGAAFDYSGGVWTLQSVWLGGRTEIVQLENGWWRLTYKLDVSEYAGSAGNTLVPQIRIQTLATYPDKLIVGFGAHFSQYNRDDVTPGYVYDITDAKLVTVADHTFVVNPFFATRRLNIKSGENPRKGQALVYVKTGAYTADYILDVKQGANSLSHFVCTGGSAGGGRYAHCVGGWSTLGTAASCTTSGGTWVTVGVADHWVHSNATISIAHALHDYIMDVHGVPTPPTWMVSEVVDSSTIWLYSDDPFDDVTAKDSLGDTAIKVIHKEVEAIEDLPIVAPHGFKVKVTGGVQETESAYWVEFIADEGTGTFGKGRWVESTEEGLFNYLDIDTLPHVLVRRQDDEFGNVTGTPYKIFFTFEPYTWDFRSVGDDLTNPLPPFVSTDDVDKYVSDILLVEQRLCLLSDDGINLSEANVFENFWQTTLVSSVDSDPVLTRANHSRVSLLRYGVPFDERLILFSDRTQFVMQGDPAFIASGITVFPKLEYESIDSARPVPSGRGVFFAFPRGSSPEQDTVTFSGLREMLPSRLADADFEAPEITRAVPKYLSGKVTALAASTTESLLAALANGDTSRIYVYKWMSDERQQLVQAAWSLWEMNEEVLDVGFFRSDLAITMRRADGIHLELMTLGEGLTDGGLSWVVRLDRRIDEDGCSSVVYSAGETTFTLPYDIRSGATMRIVKKSDGTEIAITSETTTTLVVDGDESSTEVWIGEEFETLYEFTKPYVRQVQQAGGSIVQTSGETTVQRVRILHTDSVRYDVEVEDAEGNVETHEFRAAPIGESYVLLGTPYLDEGEVDVSVGMRAKDATVRIRDSSWFPFHLLSAEWDHTYEPRSVPLQG